MNTSKFSKSFFTRRQVLFLLLALLLVTGFVSTQSPKGVLAWIDDDPDDRVTPIHPPTFEAPADGFTWAMSKRYGNDTNGDHMIDSFWQRDLQKYQETYIFPDHWTVFFRGCQTSEDFDDSISSTNTYTWQIAGESTPFSDGPSCFVIHNFDAEGTYTVRLTVHDAAGNIIPAGKTNPEYFEQEVTIKDILIVSLGDSYASGEGNPDIPQVIRPKPWPWPGWDLVQPAVWQDERCHRSAISGPSLAAIAIEDSDPHTSVTFLSFACSGANINTEEWELLDANKPLGSGLLGSYWGAVPVGVDYNADHSTPPTYGGYIPPQMEQLEKALIAPAGKQARQIDALIISAGGNDIHFGNILLACFFSDDCWDANFRIKENPLNPTEYTLGSLVQRALGHWNESGPQVNLPANYVALHDRIEALQPAPPTNVYLTQYPDMTRADSGDYCSAMMADIFWPSDILKINHWEAYNAVDIVLGPLNNHVREAAQQYELDNWQFVDGLSVYDVDPLVTAGTPGLFVSGEDGQGHGYCASNNWIRRAEESELIQGPVNFRILTRGMMHPNYSGHQAYKERLLRYMMPDLVISQPQDPPAFSFYYSLDGFTDVASETTGWYLESCDSNQVCQPKIVAQAVATSTVRLDGAGVSVNGVDACAIEGVSCEIPTSTDENQVTYEVEITASGTYQFRFVAQDSSGQVSSLEREIKVDLEGPVLVTPVGPFEVQEGGSLTLTANANAYDEGVLNYDWDLDNDGTFETMDEQPVFSAAGLDGPVSQTIQVQVTDRAGRMDAGQATVNVLNVAPSAGISGTLATNPEGITIVLTGQVIDPGSDDIFTYAWSVKKDGSSSDYASGTEANFSFTPDDNGSYEVSLAATDDDGGVGTTSQTIAVTNVDPSLSNVSVPSTSVNEGASVTISGDIADPGSADALELTIDWGDGSTPEQVSLSAGSTSFSRSYTYADDNPSGTASDSYSIALTIVDDDGGTGTSSATLVVDNLAPTLTISAPDYGTLYAINATVSLSANLTDPSSLDTLTCSINWGDGVTESGTLSAGVCTVSRVFTAAGVYGIQMTVTDDDTGANTESVMVVVYDPSAGFVTGGGWIESPTGAYLPDPSLTGQAHFGFVAKYNKGNPVPIGNTAFEFDVAGMAFASQSYEWLVVNQGGTNAQFKGSGLINGASDPNGNEYKFMVWAGDGPTDTFRIRIWWEDASGEHDVYDNGVSQAIGGGNIVVHTSK